MTADAWRPIWRYVRRTAVIWPLRRTEPDPIQLPADVVDASSAIAMLRELWPVLVDALEPGSASPRYGRRTDRRVDVGACDSCGGPREWRAPSGRTTPDGVSALPTWQPPPPGDGIRRGNVLPDVERLRPYCPTCDQPNTPKLAEIRLPIVPAVHDVLVDAAAAVLDIETYTAGSLGLTALAGAAGPVERLTHLERLLPALVDDRELADEVTVDLLAVVRSVRRAIRDVELVIAIDKPARCPWCNGRSLVMWPHRGETNPHLIEGRMTFARGLVECTQRDCRCDDLRCACHRRLELVGGHQPYAGYRHQWNNAEWRDLGERLGVDLHALAARGE